TRFHKTEKTRGGRQIYPSAPVTKSLRAIDVLSSENCLSTHGLPGFAMHHPNTLVGADHKTCPYNYSTYNS
ncbi:MAG TPA: hypothetical protein DCL60_12600, partial [Armatimonadetes bacterium]|nr:hypothetical protein [Armatimonadota bacterium]